MKNKRRNWRDYNKGLIQRGAVELWIDKKSLSSWYAATSAEQGRGRPYYFSDNAIRCLLTLKYVYRLSLRATEGFAGSLLRMMKIGIEVPSYTQLSRRQKTVKLPPLPKWNRTLYMVVDSSGLKVFGEGEWKVRQHGYSKHRDWMKLHLGIDERSQLIVSAELTDNHCGDPGQLEKLLAPHQGRVKKVAADAGYDYHSSYEVITQMGAQPVIAPIINPRHPRKRLNTLRWEKPRDVIRWVQEQAGVKRWKIANDYHRRSLVETAFYRFKTILGGTLSARCVANQRTEALLKCHILNTMTMKGIPSTL